MSHNNHDSKMMWLMMLFCALPLLVILLLSGKASGGYGWFAILVIGAFAIGHFWLMRKGHGNHEEEDKGRSSDQKEHSHH